ncbi:MAG: chemotaxis response regulator protein-glutamate methylesterase [Proteobacteria bacterium]|nr:chemotaxis response regulator protein-glutamate methylesterase [Pseudomonadota bacterium]
MKKIRVLIVDDSPVVRSILERILTAEPDIEVLATASDPYEAKKCILEQAPDVVTLDVEMPRMDGITFLKRLMSYRPLPVIMISSFTTENSRKTLEALEAGAVDFVPKPTADLEGGLAALSRDIVAKVRIAATARVRPALVRPRPVRTPAVAGEGRTSRLYKIVAVGASTGGTQAIERLLSSITFQPNGILIVQHMPARYTQSFAQRLNAMVPFEVSEAKDRDRVEKDRVLIAPGGLHMRLARDAKGFFVRTDDRAPVNHQRPSVDVLFSSVAQEAGRESVGVVLTGMGDDGARGLLAMRRSGAYTIAQDQATSVVFGMPRAAIEMGAATDVTGLHEIAEAIQASARKL